MCLSDRVIIKSLEVHSSSRFAGPFWTYYHAVTPCDWSANRDFLNHTESTVSVQTIIHILLPMHRNWNRLVYSKRCCFRVYHQPHGRTGHHRESLMFTNIKCAAFIVIQEPLFELIYIIICGWIWNYCRRGWWRLSARTLTILCDTGLWRWRRINSTQCLSNSGE